VCGSKKKLYILTGSTRGIGLELQKIFQNNGVDHVCLNRKDVDLSDIQKVIEFLSSFKQVIKKQYFNHRIVYINNASTLGNPAPLGNNSLNDISKTLNINFVSPVLIFNFLNTLTNEWVLFNITSGAARTENKYLGLYSTTKLAVEKYAKFIQLEETNCMKIHNYNPGIVKTDMYRVLKNSKFFHNMKFENAVPRNATNVAHEIWDFLQG
tara:strand:+ start:2028 stop:2657 length:630 start_codon:yes stop_codon:yes gene_type:complete